jgi:hypothetical protein
VTHILRFRGVDYYLGLRGRPYTDHHTVFGAPFLRQEEFGFDHILLSAIMSKIYGDEYELFFNSATPTTPNLHVQCIKKTDTLWDSEIRKWPCFALEVADNRPEKAAQRAYILWLRQLS